MNQQQYSRRPQIQRQVQDVMAQCRKCGGAINERMLNQHERGCKPRVPQQTNQYQSRRQTQQQPNQTNTRQQQSNTSNRQQQNNLENFQQNFQWLKNPFFKQHNQQTQSSQSDDSDDQDQQGNETQQPGFKYSCQVSGNQIPENIQIQFSAIFGPDGVFTQSMNHMNNVMQSVNINFNRGGNQQNVYTFNSPNVQSNQQVYYGNQDEQYEQDDDDDELQEEEEDEVEEEEQEEQGLDDEQISQMPTIYYRGTRAKEGSYNHCVVCISDFKLGDRLRTLRCFHKFHANCVDNWLRMNIKCPTCRHDQTK